MDPLSVAVGALSVLWVGTIVVGALLFGRAHPVRLRASEVASHYLTPAVKAGASRVIRHWGFCFFAYIVTNAASFVAWTLIHFQIPVVSAGGALVLWVVQTAALGIQRSRTYQQAQDPTAPLPPVVAPPA